MVQPVEVLQPAGVLLAPLQLVDERDLAAHQVLRTPADVAEHLGHVAPAGRLPLHQPCRGLLDAFEGAGQVADLVLGAHVDRC